MVVEDGRGPMDERKGRPRVSVPSSFVKRLRPSLSLARGAKGEGKSPPGKITVVSGTGAARFSAGRGRAWATRPREQATPGGRRIAGQGGPAPRRGRRAVAWRPLVSSPVSPAEAWRSTDAAARSPTPRTRVARGRQQVAGECQFPAPWRQSSRWRSRAASAPTAPSWPDSDHPSVASAVHSPGAKS